MQGRGIVCTWLLLCTHLDTVGEEAGCEGPDPAGEGESVHLAGGLQRLVNLEAAEQLQRPNAPIDPPNVNLEIGMGRGSVVVLGSNPKSLTGWRHETKCNYTVEKVVLKSQDSDGPTKICVQIMLFLLTEPFMLYILSTGI